MRDVVTSLLPHHQFLSTADVGGGPETGRSGPVPPSGRPFFQCYLSVIRPTTAALSANVTLESKSRRANVCTGITRGWTHMLRVLNEGARGLSVHPHDPGVCPSGSQGSAFTVRCFVTSWKTLVFNGEQSGSEDVCYEVFCWSVWMVGEP